MSQQPLLSLAIAREQDVVSARQRAREVAASIGFDAQDQTRIATAVSEIARNAYRYAQLANVEFMLEGQTAPQLLIVRIRDRGPGIPNLQEILSGNYRSATGMGLGLLGAQRLMDQCDIRSEPGQGTDVQLKKLVPRHVPLLTPQVVEQLGAALARKSAADPVQELQQQNGELLRTLSELRDRQQELQDLNRELEDTNRGVVALYAELDEKADHLRRADEMKSRFLSNMSHEFRTPLNSIQALSRLLLERADGPLGDEQEKQVRFIVKAAKDLTELVDDLLDLAKIAAGKTEVRPIEFSIGNLFSALRGMLRPLLVSEHVRLVFDDVDPALLLHSDEGKVSQILRNLISNALKFTERGEVRVGLETASDALPAGGEVLLFVSDTGVGIQPEDQARIFDEFVQVQNRLQSRSKGTGLGLPLCRSLARLLGGQILLESEPGVGSTFRVRLPTRYRQQTSELPPPQPVLVDPALIPVLVVDDEPETLFLYEKYLSGSRYQCVTARNLVEARRALDGVRPRAIVLDILLRGEESWQWLAELKSAAATRDIPVIVATTIHDPRKAQALGADEYLLKPVHRATLLAKLEETIGASVLVIDDDPAARYLVRRLLGAESVQVLEAVDGRSGLELARRCQPRLIFLDLQLPDLPGEEVLRMLRGSGETQHLPVAILTASVLSDAERLRLEAKAQAVVHKGDLDTRTARELLSRHGVERHAR